MGHILSFAITNISETTSNGTCDLCGHELRLKNRKNTQGFVSHRGRKWCRRRKQKEEIYQTRAARSAKTSELGHLKCVDSFKLQEAFTQQKNAFLVEFI